MNPERRAELDRYLEQLIDLDHAEREAAFEQLCPDEQTRRQVMAMLARSNEVATRLAGAIETSSQLLLDNGLRADRLGVYRLVRQIGAGGMGAVYLAQRADGQFEQQVAVKLLHLPIASQAMRERFRQERQILAGLHHPHIAQLLDGGDAEHGAPYLVMEFVDGVDLAAHTALLPLKEKLRLFLQVCDAVEYAHRHLIVHRDLKMSNILVTPDGQVKLLDFGIAKVLQADGGAAGPGTHIMTPEFASPEQVLGREITTLSDVYSLGIVLYMLLTGQSPYRTTTGAPAELVEAVARQDVPPPSHAAKAIGDELDSITLKAVRKEPERRYQSVSELAADLRAYLEGRPVLARPDTFAYRARKFVSRNPWGVTATVLAALLLVAFIGTALVQSRRLQQERDIARHERDNAQWLSRFLIGVFQVADPREGAGDKVTARELLDRGARRMAGETSNPDLQALVGSTIGKAYYGLGLLKVAERTALDAYAAAARGASNETRLQTLQALEDVYREMSQPAKLMRFAREHEQLAGPGDSIERAKALSEQGSAMLESRKFDQARRLHDAALAILQRLGRERTAEAGTMWNNAANAEYMAGVAHYPAAMQCARKSVEILRSTGPKPELLLGLNSVAVVAMSMNDFTTAEPFALESLALTRQIYGDNHPTSAMNYNNLCGLYTLMKRPLDALPHCRAAVAIRKETYPAGHRYIGVSLNNLGKALLAAQRWDEAGASYRESYAMLKKDSTGPAARAVEGIGHALRGKGEWKASSRYLHEALDRWKKIPSVNTDELRRIVAEVDSKL
ncbi:MAG: serine/threonine protein kinase [Acidobacteria bacterium]|nr:serine/threonine protein kinase [Acidobacteriota bacterium]